MLLNSYLIISLIHCIHTVNTVCVLRTLYAIHSIHILFISDRLAVIRMQNALAQQYPAIIRACVRRAIMVQVHQMIVSVS